MRESEKKEGEGGLFGEGDLGSGDCEKRKQQSIPYGGLVFSAQQWQEKTCVKHLSIGRDRTAMDSVCRAEDIPAQTQLLRRCVRSSE